MPDISSPSQKYFKRLTQNGYANNTPASSFSENWDQAVSLTMYENLSNSEKGVMGNYQKRRDQTLLNYYNSGQIPKDVFRNFQSGPLDRVGFRGDLLARYLKKNTNLKIDDDDDIKNKIRGDLLLAKERFQDTQARATVGGKIAGAVGSFVPYALDPLVWPTLAIGYGQAAVGAKFLASLGAVVGVEGAVESAIQYKSYKWRKQVSEASVEDSVTSVAMVMGLVGGIGIGAKVLSTGMRKFMKAHKRKQMSVVGRHWAEHKIGQMIDEMSEADFYRHIDAKVSNARLRDKLVAMRTVRIKEAKAAGKEIPVGKAKVVPEEVAKPGLPEGGERSAPIEKPRSQKILESKGKKVDNPKSDEARWAAKSLSSQDLLDVVTGEKKELYLGTKDGIVHRVDFASEEARIKFQSKLKVAPEPEVKPITAVEHAKRLDAEEKHLNNVNIDRPITDLEDLPDINKGGGSKELPKPLAKEGGERSAEGASRGAVKQELSDTLDVVVDRMLTENPDLELPVGIQLVDGREQVMMRKASDVFKEIEDNAELVNKFKECLVGT